MTNLTLQQKYEAVCRARAEFPETFGLRSWPTKTFRVSADESFYSDAFGVMLYADVLVGPNEWCPFVKGTPAEMNRERTDPPSPAYVIAVYETSEYYGGPEEGGWYYERGRRIITASVRTADTRAAATELAARWNRHLRRAFTHRKRWPDERRVVARVFHGAVPPDGFPAITPRYE